MLAALAAVSAAALAAPAPRAPGESAQLVAELTQLSQTHRFLESVQLVQGDQTVWEYFEHASLRDAPHPLRSAGKSVLSAGLGAIAGERAVAAVEARVWPAFGKLLPAPSDPPRARMSFEHVITMRSGHACRALGSPHNPCDPGQMHTREPWKEFLLAPMRDEPGTRFVYSDGAPHVIAALLVLIGGKDAERLLREALLAPLGMDKRAGIERMSPADMRRFGTLMLQQGCWNARQLIGRDWVERSTRSHVTFPPPHADTGYGYFWWTRRVTAGARTIEIYYAAGNGGQLIMVVPALDALLLSTGNAYDRLDALGALIDALVTQIVPLNPEPRGPDAVSRCMAGSGAGSAGAAPAPAQQVAAAHAASG